MGGQKKYPYLDLQHTLTHGRRFINTSKSAKLFIVTMRLNMQRSRIHVRNFDEYFGTGMVNSLNKHGDLLPDSIRCIISGPSNSGKTNALLNLLFDPNGLVFENIYVFSKSLYQPKYQFLVKTLPKEIAYFAYDENEQILNPSDAKPNSIIIFDDISCEKHNNIRNYFSMGRHKNIDTFYLGQSYSRIPKQLIRDNCNFIILFKQDDMNLRHVYSDHVNTDMSFERFKDLCGHVWRESHGFVVIDKTRDLNNGRYRLRFDSFIEGL